MVGAFLADAKPVSIEAEKLTLAFRTDATFGKKKCEDNRPLVQSALRNLTGSAFQKLNTEQVWADVSRKVRPPLGAVTSRTLLSAEELPAPPHGYQVVKFRTSFANEIMCIYPDE